jgi:hypothetical protein
MPIVSRLLGRQTDARWLIGAGLLLIAASNYWMSQMNLDISPVAKNILDASQSRHASRNGLMARPRSG